MAKKRAKSPSTSKSKSKRAPAGANRNKRPPARAKAKTAKKPARKSAAVKPESKPKSVARSGDPLDTLIAGSARVLALPVKAAWQPTVKTNLDVTLKLAALFADFPLPDDAEPAPVFVA